MIMKTTENEILRQLYEIHKSCLSDEEDENDNDNHTFDVDSHLIFLFVEKELESRSLTFLNQLPIEGAVDVIQLVNSLPADPLLFAAMQKMKMTVMLKFPKVKHQNIFEQRNDNQSKLLNSPYLTGTGFHSNLDQSSQHENVFASDDLYYPSMIGFALPKGIACQRIGKIFNIFQVFKSHDAYIMNRLKQLDLPIGLQFKGNPKNGYNVSHRKSYADIAFTYVREYRLFSLTMKPSADLNPNFVTRVKEICNYSVDEFFGLKQWEEMFSIHGTHTIHSANGGGKIVITILENRLKTYFKTDDLSKKEKEIEELLSKYLDCYDVENEQALESLLISSIKFYGGDSKFEDIDLTKCNNRNEMMCSLKEWINSLPFRPIMLDSTISIESIPNILDRKGLSKEATILDNAIKKLFGKSIRTINNKSNLENQKITRWSFW